MSIDGRTAGAGIEKSAEGRHQDDHQQPGDFAAVVPGAVEQVHTDQRREDCVQRNEVGEVVPQEAEEQHHDADLQQDQQRDHACPAEKRAQKAAPTFFQKSAPFPAADVFSSHAGFVLSPLQRICLLEPYRGCSRTAACFAYDPGQR